MPQKDLEILIKECLEGKEQAQIEFYNLFAGKIRNICFRYSKDIEETKDLLQESFIKIFSNLDKAPEINLLEFWIKRIAINVSINYYNSKKKEIVSTTDDLDKLNVIDRDLEDIDEDNYNAQEIMKILQTLPEEYKVVFTLSVIDEYKHKDIAEMLNISESNSKTRLMRARNLIKQQLISKIK